MMFLKIFLILKKTLRFRKEDELNWNSIINSLINMILVQITIK